MKPGGAAKVILRIAPRFVNPPQIGHFLKGERETGISGSVEDLPRETVTFLTLSAL
jgi:hypothetical protein